MEGLQELSASQSNDKWQFNHLQNRSPSGYTAIKITTFSTKEPLYESRSIAWNQAEDVLDVLANHPVPNGGEDAEAYLELLKIPIDDHEVLQIAKQDFLNIIACYNIHPYIRQLLQNNSYGFHQYPAQQGNSSTFYIGTLLYILIWSFDAATMTTAAILLPRESNGFTNGAAAFDEFQTILRIHKSHLYSPYLLAFIAGMHITRWLDNWTYHHLRGIRNAEQATGHGPYGWAGKISLDVDAITRCSRHIGEILVNLANQLRHEDIMDSLIASISDDDSYKNSCRTQILFPKLYDEGMQTFRSVKSALQRQMMSRRSTVTYLQERARSQSTVLFTLLAHADATSSNRLATAAKDESFSLRTIAVMTMAFLPATYFAALFAVPSLKWDQPGDVIQSNFWVYWAFTVPSTLVVFFLWYLVTNWSPRWLFGG